MNTKGAAIHGASNSTVAPRHIHWRKAPGAFVARCNSRAEIQRRPPQTSDEAVSQIRSVIVFHPYHWR